MTACVDPSCRVPRSMVTKTYSRFRLDDRDPIVEHCKCGQHPRSWTVDRLLIAWKAGR